MTRSPRRRARQGKADLVNSDHHYRTRGSGHRSRDGGKLKVHRGGQGGTQTAARPGSKAGPGRSRQRRAGPAARRTWPPTSPPASQGRAGRDHPGRCRAAGGICARAARPARGRPDARFRRRDRRPAGTGNAAPRQAGRAYAPATPGRGRQNTTPPTARVARRGEGNFVVDVAPLPDHRLVMVPRTRIQQFARSRVDTSKAMVRASSSGTRTSSCRQRGRHPGWRRPGPGAGCRARTWFRPERDRRFAWACITKS